MFRPAVPRRSAEELDAMRRAGRVVAEMHEVIRDAVRPGVTTAHLDQLARDVLDRRGAASNFLGYHGYPAVICASPNEVVVHGIPDDRPLEEGDVLSIDCGAIVDGWHGDAAFTMGVGSISDADAQLVETGRLALAAAIAAMVDGGRIGDLGAAVSDVAVGAGYSIARDYTGHGIGRAMHESPEVPNHGRRGHGLPLRSGVVLAIEPMVCAGRGDVRELADGWTVVTLDGGRAVHWEHTVAVTDDGPEVLTRLG